MLAAVGAVLLAAGCGGGDGSAAGTNGGQITVETGSLSKAEFIKRANTICEKTKERFFDEMSTLQRISEKSSAKPETSPQYAAIAAVMNPLYNDMADRIRALGAPAGDEKQISELVNAIPRDIDELNERPVQGFKDGTPLSETLRVAEAYGLNGCVKSLT